jgi:eukaryotic-like serine/threonine-protein kinase
MAASAPERVVADRYVLKAPLGRGGMGVVWHAQDTVLGRAVAVKEVVFPPTMPDDERRAAHARVLREARAAARLNHPGAVTLYDVVQDQGHPFIVMELVPATTLADLVRTEGPLEPWRAAELGSQLAGALEAAHRAGIVHRDVKPGNVMVGEDGGVKLADFGVASLQGDPQLTATGLVIGSPAYMAPEQAAGEPSGPPADFWALGATLYFAVEGESPFEKASSIATLAAVVNDDPRPMRRAGPLAPVIAALLVKDPAARPSGPQLRARLDRLARAAPAATEVLPAHQEPPASTTAPMPVVPPPAAAPAAPEPAGPEPAASEPAAEPATPESAAEPVPPPVVPAAREAAEPAAPAAAETAGPEPAGPPPPARTREADQAGPEPHPAEPTGRQAPGPAPAAGPAAVGPRAAGGLAPGAGWPGFGVQLPPPEERPAPGAPRPLPPVVPPRRAGGGRLLGALALLVLAGVLIVWAATALLPDRGGGRAATGTTRGGAAATTRPTGTTRQATTGASATTKAAPSTTAATGGLPARWTSFTNRRGNDAVGVPPGWQTTTRASYNAVVVEEPGGARRVFTVRSTNPANPLPQASLDYRAYARQNFQGYREIRFDENATYAGRSGAVVFEYEAVRDGRRVHVSHVNLKGRSWGYNVEFVAPADRWDASQQLIRQFEQAFRPLG